MVEELVYPKPLTAKQQGNTREHSRKKKEKETGKILLSPGTKTTSKPQPNFQPDFQTNQPTYRKLQIRSVYLYHHLNCILFFFRKFQKKTLLVQVPQKHKLLPYACPNLYQTPSFIRQHI